MSKTSRRDPFYVLRFVSIPRRFGWKEISLAPRTSEFSWDVVKRNENEAALASLTSLSSSRHRDILPRLITSVYRYGNLHEAAHRRRPGTAYSRSNRLTQIRRALSKKNPVQLRKNALLACVIVSRIRFLINTRLPVSRDNLSRLESEYTLHLSLSLSLPLLPTPRRENIKRLKLR